MAANRTNHWVALAGKAGSGKNALAQQLVEQYGFTEIAFADAIREAATALNPLIPIDMGHNGDLLKSTMRLATLVDSIGWDDAKRYHAEVRELLQRLGTEVGREIISPNVWVDLAVQQATAVGGHVVFTDCRFANEVEAVRANGGLLVRVYRPNVEAVSEHLSETAIDDVPADLTVMNVGAREELADHARTIFLTLQLKELTS